MSRSVSPPPPPPSSAPPSSGVSTSAPPTQRSPSLVIKHWAKEERHRPARHLLEHEVDVALASRRPLERQAGGPSRRQVMRRRRRQRVVGLASCVVTSRYRWTLRLGQATYSFLQPLMQTYIYISRGPISLERIKLYRVKEYRSLHTIIMYILYEDAQDPDGRTDTKAIEMRSRQLRDCNL